jgi:hypothetical protein
LIVIFFPGMACSCFFVLPLFDNYSLWWHYPAGQLNGNQSFIHIDFYSNCCGFNKNSTPKTLTNIFYYLFLKL